jgi:hypothetical protein
VDRCAAHAVRVAVSSSLGRDRSSDATTRRRPTANCARSANATFLPTHVMADAMALLASTFEREEITIVGGHLDPQKDDASQVSQARVVT